MHNVIITPVLNGWKADVGCQTIVFTDMEEMLRELRRYLKDPEGTMKLYTEKAVNAKHIIERGFEAGSSVWVSRDSRHPARPESPTSVPDPGPGARVVSDDFWVVNT